MIWYPAGVQGIDCDALLRADPRSVAAWVRKRDGAPVTLADMRAAPGGAALTADAILRAWGAVATTPVFAALRLDAASLKNIGLDAPPAQGWQPQRWGELTGAVPEPIYTPAPERKASAAPRLAVSIVSSGRVLRL